MSGTMLRNASTRHSRTRISRAFTSRFWRGRALQLAIVSTGLVTAIAAAQIATKPDQDPMSRAIAKQKVTVGQPANAAPERQRQPLSPEQMLAAAESYDADIKMALEHGETLRVGAYRSKDIIRMTCVDEKLGQMKEISGIAKPRFTTIKQAGIDEFTMRNQFTTIREGAERVKQLAEEMEACVGDALDDVTMGKINEEQRGPGASIADPTQPPTPTIEVERPGFASPDR
jgi:hypothetical protein